MSGHRTQGNMPGLMAPAVSSHSGQGRSNRLDMRPDLLPEAVIEAAGPHSIRARPAAPRLFGELTSSGQFDKSIAPSSQARPYSPRSDFVPSSSQMWRRPGSPHGALTALPTKSMSAGKEVGNDFALAKLANSNQRPIVGARPVAPAPAPAHQLRVFY